MTNLRRFIVDVWFPILSAVCVAAALVVPLGAADPIRVVLLVDSSTNMSTMLTNFRAGLTAFVEAIPDDVEVAFISTGGQLRVRVPPTTDRQRLLDAAGRFASDGGANSFLETLLESDARFLRPMHDRRPIFVVLTTDQPAYRRAANRALQQLHEGFRATSRPRAWCRHPLEPDWPGVRDSQQPHVEHRRLVRSARHQQFAADAHAGDRRGDCGATVAVSSMRPLSPERRDRFDVRRVREEIEAGDVFERVACVHQLAGVASQRRDVARDVHDRRRLETDRAVQRLFRHPRAGRIHDNDRRRIVLASRERFDRLVHGLYPALRAGRVGHEIVRADPVALNGNHLRLPQHGGGDRKQPRPGVEVDDTICRLQRDRQRA